MKIRTLSPRVKARFERRLARQIKRYYAVYIRKLAQTIFQDRFSQNPMRSIDPLVKELNKKIWNSVAIDYFTISNIANNLIRRQIYDGKKTAPKLDSLTSFEMSMIDFVNRRKLTSIMGISPQASNKIKEAVTLTIATGEGQNLAASLITEIGKNFSATRASTIARTEMGIAAEVSNRKSFKSLKVEKAKKEWQSVSDSRRRKYHEDMEGMTVDQDSQFEVNGPNGVELMSGPSDPSASGSQIINCRCTMGFIT